MHGEEIGTKSIVVGGKWGSRVGRERSSLVVGTALARLMNARQSTPAQNDQHDKHPISEPVGHVPTDLMGDHHPRPKDRAIDAFRPDMSAPVPPEEREAYRPVTLKVKRHFGTHQLRMRA